tara:strand:- start:278 stop:682 length:405 start_codon:yes stop_codon:yes gene_type:complete
MKKLSLFFILCFFSPMGHTNCVTVVEDICAELEWIDGPHLGKTSHMEVRFYDMVGSQARPIAIDYDVNLYSWMVMDNGHSHPGPQFAFYEISPGIFESKDVRFFMGRMQGYWQIKLELLKEQKIVGEHEFAVEF